MKCIKNNSFSEILKLKLTGNSSGPFEILFSAMTMPKQTQQYIFHGAQPMLRLIPLHKQYYLMKTVR